jgi:hypothetical protein
MPVTVLSTDGKISIEKDAPAVSREIRNIIAKGSQILLPFDVSDASVSFTSRWELAEMIERLVIDAVQDVDCGED